MGRHGGRLLMRIHSVSEFRDNSSYKQDTHFYIHHLHLLSSLLAGSSTTMVRDPLRFLHESSIKVSMISSLITSLLPTVYREPGSVDFGLHTALFRQWKDQKPHLSHEVK